MAPNCYGSRMMLQIPIFNQINSCETAQIVWFTILQINSSSLPNGGLEVSSFHIFPLEICIKLLCSGSNCCYFWGSPTDVRFVYSDNELTPDDLRIRTDTHYKSLVLLDNTPYLAKRWSCGKIWEDMGRYGKIWEDMGRYGQMGSWMFFLKPKFI